jgi:hypothetical protein
MAILQLNVGLWVNGKVGNIGPRTVVEDVMQTIPNYGHIARVDYAKETGEPTVVLALIVADTFKPDAPVNFLCDLLQQDCIAGKLGDEGFLIGPRTEPYGNAFNPDYFIPAV